MTHRIFFLALGVALGGAIPLRAADSAPVPAPKVEVVFSHPENFTDVKDRSDPTDEGRDAILEMLRECVVSEAVKHLPAGASLSITFTDVDLAGDFEPWRGRQYDQIRVVRPAYPPAFKFNYVIRGSSGAVWKSGKDTVRDLDFEQREILDTSDSLRIEKSILKEWIRTTLEGIK
jgi:Protein of unknown function (DUF3016)